MDEDDVKTCECGCGEPVTVAYGKPKRFRKGHHLRHGGAPWYKGDKVGYRALHTHLNKYYPKTGICDECGKATRTDYALIEGREYSREREDYRELCRKCHVDYDGIGRYVRKSDIAKQQAGPAPFCKCGCGATTEWDRSRRQWRKYALGHYNGVNRSRHLQKPDSFA